MRFNIPNILSLLRLFLIPVLVVAYYLPYAWAPFAAATIFFIASFTDWLDGMLARKLGQTSRFGAFIDPVADKVLVATALILITEQYYSVWVTVPAITMIGREVIISALREWMAEIGKRASVAVSWVGKVKTASQMFALWFLIWGYNDAMIWAGYIGLYIATALTYWSMMQYLSAAKSDLLNKDYH
ncbi:CDP-diacylglycerol--glycerol-3-phosphate 3-phosphatidyltransferase [Vibrio sp. 10N.286.49.B3]|uniref:CDP-diacylglycerol--glycerol-3-phosphate 3-phosphatidyltransferase n=1 Tax=Vibrio sp. 10N.286.49.B3 TaxID=1880855 RepID=UPI000C8630CF|nr:CDP-diacylglycerol--glycerol-3-phosphate 3-phosphatidyltransferase [Vibrio sp. 10N.286.49.B3]PMH46608.1 CDP-diacylglycerol--glycerol-3-phosphate 3-phosphatidyltransferase [Vibrio sp. 10N.286.49.B3]